MLCLSPWCRLFGSTTVPPLFKLWVINDGEGCQNTWGDQRQDAEKKGRVSTADANACMWAKTSMQARRTREGTTSTRMDRLTEQV